MKRKRIKLRLIDSATGPSRLSGDAALAVTYRFTRRDLRARFHDSCKAMLDV
jgi:hypothetical protein